MQNQKRIKQLELYAAKCRQNVMHMIRAGGHGHVGGALSAIDVVTALYFDKMNVDPKNPKMENRDRFLLSAGHKCLSQYAVLAEKGYFDKAILESYGSFKSLIPGHPNMHKLPGIEANTGALGHGMSIAAGMAMAAKQNGSSFNVYVVTGDGELPEGSNWEAAAAAAKFGVDNLTVFVDNNGLQISGKVTDVMNMEDISGKFRSFGWSAVEIDGNNMEELVNTLNKLPIQEGKPTAVIMHTTKAKGLYAGENKPEYHFWNPTEEDLDKADKDLEMLVAKLEKELEEKRND